MKAFIGRYLVVAAAVTLLTGTGYCSADDFMVKLSLKNAHLRSVFLGCQETASSGYDRRIDDFAPPPGIQTGYVGFVPGVKGLPLYYKDVRGPQNEHEWQFYVKVHEGKPLTISWDKADFPASWSFSAATKTGVLDMKEAMLLTLTETQIVKIKGKKAAIEAPREPAAGKVDKVKDGEK